MLGDRFSTESYCAEWCVSDRHRAWWAPRIADIIADALNRRLPSHAQVLQLGQEDYSMWLVSQDFIEKTAAGYRLKTEQGGA